MPPVFHQDNYDKCMLLDEEALYCSFTYKMTARNDNNTDIWKIIQEVSSNKYNYRHDHLRHWICIPWTCPEIESKFSDQTTMQQSIRQCYDEKYGKYGIMGEVENLKCENNIPKYHVDSLDVAVAMIFVCYVVLIAFATFYEGTARYKTEEEYKKLTCAGWRRIASAFSIPRNWYRLITVKSTTDIEKLRPIQGVRFYNTILVILSHTVMTFLIGPVANTKYAETLMGKVATLFLSSGPLCVSTFFFMSSFLLIYGIFSQFENRKVKLKDLLGIFINRYIRLTPSVVVVIAFYATWWRHFGSGPHWNDLIGKEFLRCRNNWWINLFYLNNFIERENMCLVQTWYLALDTQYFVFLLVLVWILKKYEKLVWPILCSFFTILIAATFLDNYNEGHEALILPLPEKLYGMKLVLGNTQWYDQMMSWKGNLVGCIIGLAYGYSFYKNKNKSVFEINIANQIIYHILTYGLALGVIIVPGILIFNSEMDHSIFWASLHVAFGRPIFSFAIGFAIYGAIFGLGWVTKSVMEWPPSYILGRLSYSTYLVHATIILSRVASSRYPTYVSDLHMVYYLFGDVATAFAAGFIMTLSVEMPLSDLQKLMIPMKELNGEKKK
nr:nose resistant to fluoxetine protein 6-like [Leptinotarsa decemlineata]